ncbi:MAG: hypothetical protein ACI8VE_002936 [Natrialbaceae archaeon]|jgi:hypothetical protein
MKSLRCRRGLLPEVTVTVVELSFDLARPLATDDGFVEDAPGYPIEGGLRPGHQFSSLSGRFDGVVHRHLVEHAGFLLESECGVTVLDRPKRE